MRLLTPYIVIPETVADLQIPDIIWVYRHKVLNSVGIFPLPMRNLAAQHLSKIESSYILYHHGGIVFREGAGPQENHIQAVRVDKRNTTAKIQCPNFNINGYLDKNRCFYEIILPWFE